MSRVEEGIDPQRPMEWGFEERKSALRIEESEELNPRMEALRKAPEFPWLEAGDKEGLERVLQGLGWLKREERVRRAEAAGDGNMNLTLRIETDARTFILKQARPWVEKYPELAAPWERSSVEQAFYRRAAGTPGVGEAMPGLIAADEDAHLLALEDLPGARDLTDLYAGAQANTVSDQEFGALADYLAHLHGSSDGAADRRFENRAMRQLNHAHIYEIPLDPENALDLDSHEEGLASAARDLMADSEFCGEVRRQGERYLRDGPTLLHGDYFPGSWLRSDVGLRIIDPEFTYYGEAEYDLGCAVGHFALARLDIGRAEMLLERYSSALPSANASSSKIARNAAIEVMRRLIGVAQLPLPATAGWRAELLARSRCALLSGEYRELFS